jgi:5-methylcytosine-specific restriction endonuclease McrA
MDKNLRDLLSTRANSRCEYCRFPEKVSIRPFHADHIIAEQHGGMTSLANLAWACNRCNLHKGPNLSGVDPVSNETVLLFNPRKDSWDEHFAFQGAIIRGLTARGRATIQVLNENDPIAVATRAALMDEGNF